MVLMAATVAAGIIATVVCFAMWRLFGSPPHMRGLVLSLPWLLTAVLFVPAAYRRGIRDHSRHTTPTAGIEEPGMK
jgi:hypothetical protein